MPKTIRVVFTGGGTAGHVYPGLTVINLLYKHFPQVEFFWIGSCKGVERNLLKGYPFLQYRSIHTGKYRRVHSWRDWFSIILNCRDIFYIAMGVLESVWHLGRIRPAFVFSQGGYVSVPVMVGAWFWKQTFFTHESDSTPGLATKINAYYAKRIFVSRILQNTQEKRWKHKTIPVGHILREEIQQSNLAFSATHLQTDLPPSDRETVQTLWAQWDIPHSPLQSKPLLLILGGSLGAQQINFLLYPLLKELLQDCWIIHQTGHHSIPYSYTHYYPFPFLPAPLLTFSLQKASVVLARAGANSIGELAYYQKAVIFYPLEEGSRGDQVENVRHLNRGKVLKAPVLPTRATSQQLQELIQSLLPDSPEKFQMQKTFHESFTYNGAKMIVQYLSPYLLTQSSTYVKSKKPSNN